MIPNDLTIIFTSNSANMIFSNLANIIAKFLEKMFTSDSVNIFTSSSVNMFTRNSTNLHVHQLVGQDDDHWLCQHVHQPFDQNFPCYLVNIFTRELEKWEENWPASSLVKLIVEYVVL